MGGRCRSQEVGAAWPDRTGCHHDLPSALGFGIGDPCQGHRLFILPPPGRHFLANRFQGFSETGHVPMSENGKNSGK